jgi:hypothetical protein
MRAADIAHAGAAEPRDGERSISQCFVSGVDLDDAATARAVDFDAKPKRVYLAKCREGQSVEHPPTLDRRRRASLPAVLIPAAPSPLPVVACSSFFGMSGLRQMSASIPKHQPPGIDKGNFVPLDAVEFRNGYAVFVQSLHGELPADPTFPTTAVDPATGRRHTGR